jgi:2-polyprenyl-6-methoxyphenol hydroxylase-like FAD-dependent oxidoreductase
MDTPTQPILIIGGGIAGLTLAQACRKEHIPYRLFERDESPSSRGAGWGLTLAQALPAFKNLVPEDIITRLPEAYVNTEAFKAGEHGNFTFFDLSTGEAKWKVPPAERIRVSRERLRNLMLTGLNMEWNKTLTNVVCDDSSVTAFFHDGSSANGSMLVACDGAHSVVRSKLHPSDHNLLSACHCWYVQW